MEETKVDMIVRDLVADHDRLDGFLSKTHVERLLEKRQLTVEEGAEVDRRDGSAQNGLRRISKTDLKSTRWHPAATAWA